MKKIKLTQGKFAIVDDEDFHYLNRFNWHLAKDGSGHHYAVKRFAKRRNQKCFEITIAYMIINTDTVNTKIAHKNRNTLDNRKQNLIPTSWHSTRHNKKNTVKNKTSIYRGVSFRKGIKSKPWRTMIQKNKVTQQFYFKVEKDAAIKYNKIARELYGEMAYQNKI